jgi:hypothetical protein
MIFSGTDATASLKRMFACQWIDPQIKHYLDDFQTVARSAQQEESKDR